MKTVDHRTELERSRVGRPSRWFLIRRMCARRRCRPLPPQLSSIGPRTRAVSRAKIAPLARTSAIFMLAAALAACTQSSSHTECSVSRAPRWAEAVSQRNIGGLPVRVTDRKTGVVFVLIQPGRVKVDSSESDETDSADRGAWFVAEVTRPYYIAEREISQRVWVTTMGSNPASVRVGELLPVEGISDEDLGVFLKRTKFRLPTEAEWLLAASGGSAPMAQVPLPEYGWYDFTAEEYWESRGKPSESGSFSGPVPCALLSPHSAGLYATLGNVAEICSDWHERMTTFRGVRYNPTGPPGPTSGGRVIRGGRYSDPHYEISLRWRAAKHDVGPDEVGIRPARNP